MILLLGAVLSLCLLPSLLFLGLWRGLVRMQRSSLVARTSDRVDATDPAVTWGDVVDAYADPNQRLLGPSSSTLQSDARCPVCDAANEPFASFCGGCCRKLE